MVHYTRNKTNKTNKRDTGMPDDNCKHFLDAIPFIGLAVGRAKDIAQHSPLITRLAETAIMSIVAGGVATYVGLQLLEHDVRTLKENVSVIKHDIDKIDSKLEMLRKDLYVPRGASQHANEPVKNEI